MQQLEVEYFDEYKAVDNICRDMLSADQGVSEYIRQMEDIESYACRQVKGWYEKYKMLKHLRWIRNQIAHGEQQAEITPDDLAEIKNFHGQLLNVKDPLSIALHSQNKSLKQSSSVASNYDHTRHESNEDEGEEVTIVGVIIALLIVAIIGFVFWHII